MGNRDRDGKALRSAQGYTLLEVMTVVAILGVLATFAFPSIRHTLDRQQAKVSATQVAGLLNDARTHALSEGTPYLVYFNAPEVDSNDECSAMAVEVRDADHSYSITNGDSTHEFHLPSGACQKVKPFGEDPTQNADLASVPLPVEDVAARAVAAVASALTSGSTTGASSSGSSNSGSGSANSGSGNGTNANGNSGNATGVASNGNGSGNAGSGNGNGGAQATLAESVVNGTTFPVDATDGRPVVAFSERGIPVDPSSPTEWGSGAGGIYLTDGDSTVVAAVVAPLGEVQLRVFDASSGSWR